MTFPLYSIEVFMVSRIASIASMLLFLDCASAWSQPQPVVKRTCEPIARVLSAGDRTLKPGSLLCQGDRLQPVNNGTVAVLCYINRTVLQLLQGSISDAASKCVPQAIQAKRSDYLNPKGPGENAHAPALRRPYSSAILDPRPLLSWDAVRGATSYTVQVKGKGVNWSDEVRSNLLPYPHQQPDLQFGNAYKVTVIANQGNSPVLASSSVLILSSVKEAQQLMSIIKQIKILNLSPDDLAIDLGIAYMSQDLLTEAINVLEARIKAGTQNPTLYRLLGDRYLEAGLPDEAKREYTAATTLAQKN